MSITLVDPKARSLARTLVRVTGVDYEDAVSIAAEVVWMHGAKKDSAQATIAIRDCVDLLRKQRGRELDPSKGPGGQRLRQAIYLVPPVQDGRDGVSLEWLVGGHEDVGINRIEVNEEVDRVMSALTDGERRLVYARHALGLPPKEIAAMFGITQKSVWEMVSVATRKAREFAQADREAA